MYTTYSPTGQTAISRARAMASLQIGLLLPLMEHDEIVRRDSGINVNGIGIAGTRETASPTRQVSDAGLGKFPHIPTPAFRARLNAVLSLERDMVISAPKRATRRHWMPPLVLDKLRASRRKDAGSRASNYKSRRFDRVPLVREPGLDS